MSRFTGHLGLNLLEYSTGLAASRNGLALWWLADPLIYEMGASGSGKRLTIPALDRAAFTDADVRAIAQGKLRVRGVTDLGSIPAIGRWLIAPSDPAVKAFVPHDDGYCTLGASWAEALGRPATRAEIDRELKVAMKALGAPGWKREVVYQTVRLGGGIGWGR
ncbi:DUF1353 domain-containing protein [Phenylobacterium sp.]|uniref:DUF1353 domain-containing protein n=1 Tax=Phenylobacterium sp. TaxID=1871053 RepID=UPI003918B790